MGPCMAKTDPAFARKKHDVSTLKEKALPVVWLVGGPGSGRLTQSTKIIAHFGLTKIDSVELIQSDISTDSARGSKMKQYLDTNKPIPKGAILDLIIEKMLATVGSAKGYLMVGFPRDKGQASMFEKEIYPCTIVVYLEVSPDTQTARLLERGKPEDTDDIIKKRLKAFKANSLGVAKGYKKKCKTVNGEADPDEVFDNLKNALGGALP